MYYCTSSSGAGGMGGTAPAGCGRSAAVSSDRPLLSPPGTCGTEPAPARAGQPNVPFAAPPPWTPPL
eukprot:1175481-Prorocentrum_minimum.AAC.5